MASALIVIQRNSDGNTTPGSRDDLQIGDTVKLLNSNDTGVSLWYWTFVSVPPGSTATLSSPTVAHPTFSPDVVGTYIVNLMVNNTVTATAGVAVKTVNYVYRIPGSSERFEYNGWGPALYDALKRIDDGYGAGGGGGTESLQQAYNHGNTIVVGVGDVPVSIRANSVSTGMDPLKVLDHDGYTILEVTDKYLSGAASVYCRRLFGGDSFNEITLDGASIGNTFRFDGGAFVPYNLTEDDILPGFTPVLSFNGETVPLEVGQNLVNPAFTASYNRSPLAATLADGVDTHSLTLPATSFAYNSGPLPARTYVRTNPGDGYTWTLTATEGGPNKTSTVTETWLSRAYYGIHTIPGSYNAAFITSLSGSALEAGFARSIAYSGMTGSEKLYYCFLHSFGTPSSIKDASTGFAIPFTKVASSVSVTNTYGVMLAIDVYESDNYLTSPVTVVWS